MRTLFHILSALGIIVGLLTVVGVLFYGFSWAVLWLVRFVPVIGKRHRHAYWDELTKRSGRALDVEDGGSVKPPRPRES